MAPVTKYYDPKAPTMWSLFFSWNSSVMELVVYRGEFWGYLLWSVVATTACKYFLDAEAMGEFEWDAAAVMQYVMTFFVTFYNDRCYDRYRELYPACQEFMNGVLQFVMELNISLYHDDLRYHRIAITKYLLAMVYENYMAICGGKLSRRSWATLVARGLVTAEEAAMLETYPGGQTTLVIACWALFVLRDALVQDCLWQGRPQQTVHIYNRHVRHLITAVENCHKVNYLMAMPIPFAYYHLMNVILMFNVLLLATFPALFQEYWTVLPFGVALIVYMGLREVSTALSDPFNQDSVDFPVPDFISQIFDRCVSILIAFSRTEVRERVLSQVKNVQNFSEKQLKRTVKLRLFRPTGEEVKWGSAVDFRWGDIRVFKKDDDTVKHKLENSLIEFEDDEEEDDDESIVVPVSMEEKKVEKKTLEDEEADLERKEAAALERERTKNNNLKLQKADLEHELQKLNAILEGGSLEHFRPTDYRLTRMQTWRSQAPRLTDRTQGPPRLTDRPLRTMTLDSAGMKSVASA